MYTITSSRHRVFPLQQAKKGTTVQQVKVEKKATSHTVPSNKPIAIPTAMVNLGCI